MILVTGGSGIVGQHLKKYLENIEYIMPTSEKCNLKSEEDISNILSKYKPTTIIHLAAKVGGLFDNIVNQYDYFYTNLKINTNILHYAKLYRIQNLLTINSSCAFPEVVDSYPMIESDLFKGECPQSNYGYGIAKRTLASEIKLFQQLGYNYHYLTACNLYSEFDSKLLNINSSHFVTSIIFKLITAKQNNQKEIYLFGDGSPLRQFMYAEDLAKVIYLTFIKPANKIADYNICHSIRGLSIREMAEIIRDEFNPNIKIVFDGDISKNGQYRKDISNEYFLSDYPLFEFTPFRQGIKKVLKALETNYNLKRI